MIAKQFTQLRDNSLFFANTVHFVGRRADNVIELFGQEETGEVSESLIHEVRDTTC
jgi:hypothetical protein